MIFVFLAIPRAVHIPVASQFACSCSLPIICVTRLPLSLSLSLSLSQSHLHSLATLCLPISHQHWSCDSASLRLSHSLCNCNSCILLLARSSTKYRVHELTPLSSPSPFESTVTLVSTSTHIQSIQLFMPFTSKLCNCVYNLTTLQEKPLKFCDTF